ncbi:class I SAM-dependent methyltransferase [Hymenobacter sp. BT491]|uniref:class I SAM-dependent methyltransferase n=1 Tax=Hymenobacter sp. BT491 TaxID=2766779 RepID=UPI001653D3E0|nr:class I SAM-dependent methyltransferase [Hymenobacter sp. BT491]MBC6990801.1 class I SAM-dependent methyltransferase [Hymenobacter sp. BT491]
MKAFVVSLLLLLGAWGSAAAQQPTPQQQTELERQRWNKVLTGKQPGYVFNQEPNALLAESIKGRTPGTALDVGMGQGRNAIYLATQGWDVTGIDIADQAVALAQEKAKQAHVTIHTALQSDADYDFGTNRWDLVAFIYAGGRRYVEKVRQSLRPGGIVVIEGFHRDATQGRRIGEDVVFDTDELKKLYAAAGFKILRYEEPEGIGDFGMQRVRLVKLVAQKP